MTTKTTTTQKRVTKSPKEEPIIAGAFSTANQAYEAGKKAFNSKQWNRVEDAYTAHENRGSNLHAEAFFKSTFMQGWTNAQDFPAISQTTT